MLNSVLAVLGGFVAMTALIMIATIIAARVMLGTRGREDMMKMKPTPAFTAVNLIYSAAFAILGGFITARIAHHAPLQHALALAAVMFAMAVFSFFLQRKSNEPRWYGVVLMILGPVCASLGGYLQTLRVAA